MERNKNYFSSYSTQKLNQTASQFVPYLSICNDIATLGMGIITIVLLTSISIVHILAHTEANNRGLANFTRS